jgi:hypothetical protein
VFSTICSGRERLCFHPILLFPADEEISSLEPLADKAFQFAPADRFLWEMSKIPHYKERLAVMAFKRKVGFGCVDTAAHRPRFLMQLSHFWKLLLAAS